MSDETRLAHIKRLLGFVGDEYDKLILGFMQYGNNDRWVVEQVKMALRIQ